MRIVEEDGTVDMCTVFPVFLIGGSGIQIQYLLSVFTEVMADPFLIVFQTGLGEQDERTAFLEIVSVKNGFLVVDAFLIGKVWIFGKHMTVNGDVMLGRSFLYQVFGFHFSELRYGRDTVSFHEFLSRCQRFLITAVGMRRIDGGDGRAFHDGSSEETFSQR